MKFKTLVLVFFLLMSGALRADTASMDLENPIAIGSSAPHYPTVIALGDGSIIVWDGEDQHRIVDDYGAKPSSLTNVSHMEYHRNFVSVIGIRGGLPSMATFKLGQTLSTPADVVPGLTVPLAFANDNDITATTSTGIAIYVAVKEEMETSIWMIGANVASLDEPKEIYRGPETILAMVVNFQGHLLAVVDRDDKPTIQFHHSQLGEKLLTLPTEMEKITSLAVSPKELLYATGSKAGKQGVYRLDARFKDGKQIVRETEIQLIDGARQVVCSGDQAVVITDDRATRFNSEK